MHKKGRTKTRNSIRDIRVPVPKLHYPGLSVDKMRIITVGQLAVLLWHLYRCANDPEAGYLDADVDFSTLMTKRLNKTVNMPKADLEKLLWAGNMAEQLGFWWSPDNKSFIEFIRPMIFAKEAYDRTWCRLVPLEENKRIRNQQRYIKRITKRKRSK